MIEQIAIIAISSLAITEVMLISQIIKLRKTLKTLGEELKQLINKFGGRIEKVEQKQESKRWWKIWL